MNDESGGFVVYLGDFWKVTEEIGKDKWRIALRGKSKVVTTKTLIEESSHEQTKVRARKAKQDNAKV